MNMMTTLHQNGSASGMHSLWLRSSVQDFFSAVNWENRPLQVVEPQEQLSDSQEAIAPNGSDDIGLIGLDMKMSVRTFFDTFPWDGKPAIAEPIVLSDLSLEEADREEGITLDDFFGGL